MPLYIELLHGRSDPEDKLNDWGIEGPVLGPFRWIHTTYASGLRLGDVRDGNECGELRVIERGLLYYDGIYYGDWSILPADRIHVDIEELGHRVARFESGKEVPPPPRWTALVPPAPPRAEFDCPARRRRERGKRCPPTLDLGRLKFEVCVNLKVRRK